MPDPLAGRFVQACTLPAAWANQHSWRVLETHFDSGLNFLATWALWQTDTERPDRLHYVAISATAPDVSSLELDGLELDALKLDTLERDALASAAALKPDPTSVTAGAALAPLARLLANQCFGLLPGFHRMTFEHGRVLLTLCIGDLKTMLREQLFLADSVFLVPAEFNSSAPFHPPDWDIWATRALARCCRRGTRVTVDPSALPLTLVFKQVLMQSGFEMTADAPSSAPSSDPLRAYFSAIYNPRWEPKTNRHHPFAAPAAPAASAACALQPQSCAVIGAGLAGSSVAQALARRGWQVTVLDTAIAPADGASGVPVGLLAPHVSADDSPRSRLARAGIRLTLQQARALLVQGQDWDATGVLERRLAGPLRLPAFWQPHGLAWSAPAPQGWTHTAWGSGLPAPSAALWHAQAGWIKPAALIRAWLAQPGVRFQGGAHAAGLRRDGDLWAVLDRDNRVLTRAKIIVLAAAGGTAPLIAQWRTPRFAGMAAQHPKGSNNNDGNSGVSGVSGVGGMSGASGGVGVRGGGPGDLCRLPALHPVSGQISWAIQRPTDSAMLPPYPVNGAGSLVAHVPMGALLPDASAQTLAWFAGATYEANLADDLRNFSKNTVGQAAAALGAKPGANKNEATEATEATEVTEATEANKATAWITAQHHANLARLQTLLPASAAALADVFADASIQFWRGTRYATADRLPIVGPLTQDAHPTLWTSTGLGSRGLSLCVLCAELLAARLGGEPLPIEATLAAKIAQNR